VQATLHVRRQLAAPRSVWLAGRAAGGGQQQHLEAVERGSTMAQMMELLTVRGLAGESRSSQHWLYQGLPGSGAVRTSLLILLEDPDADKQYGIVCKRLGHH
jgi:hypothetical protein